MRVLCFSVVAMVTISMCSSNEENMSLVLDRLLMGYDKRLRPGFGGNMLEYNRPAHDKFIGDQ